jgi:hypothetical protein
VDEEERKRREQQKHAKEQVTESSGGAETRAFHVYLGTEMVGFDLFFN